MARRVVLGNVGSEFIFRVSRPGFDAATADLDQILFDADAIQARVAATGLTTVPASTYPLSPGVRTIAHGVDSPGLAIGVAQSMVTTPTVEPENVGMWVGLDRDPQLSGGNVTMRPLNWNNDLKVGWCTPWMLNADQGEKKSGNGWRIRWNATTLFIDNFQAYGIRVRWSVVEF